MTSTPTLDHVRDQTYLAANSRSHQQSLKVRSAAHYRAVGRAVIISGINKLVDQELWCSNDWLWKQIDTEIQVIRHLQQPGKQPAQCVLENSDILRCKLNQMWRVQTAGYNDLFQSQIGTSISSCHHCKNKLISIKEKHSSSSPELVHFKAVEVSV